jgi:hypothetical protein
MRFAFLAVLVGLALAWAGVVIGRPAEAADVPSQQVAQEAYLQERVDDNDDTRVEVQLVVLGIAAGSVVGVLGGAYLLRRKLGLVPPPPGDDAASHH